jgi:hypothetical protein
VHLGSLNIGVAYLLGLRSVEGRMLGLLLQILGRIGLLLIVRAWLGLLLEGINVLLQRIKRILLLFLEHNGSGQRHSMCHGV